MTRFTASLLAFTVLVLPGKTAARKFSVHGTQGDFVASALGEPLAIVVNRSNPMDALSSSDLHAIFVGSRGYWNNGWRITIVMREPGDPERTSVLREVCGMNEAQFKFHFLRGLYTGEILVSPKILSSPSGEKDFISFVPGAIGYLRLSEVDASVKVLRIDELLPRDKGYRLRVEQGK